MKVLLDTNVLVDIFMKRLPFFAMSITVWDLAEKGKFDAVITATTYTNVHYLIGKYVGQAEADEAIKLMLAAFPIATVDAAVIAEAIQMNAPDFEDAVQAIAALRVSATHVCTRDPKGFARSKLSVLSPKDLVELISA